MEKKGYFTLFRSPELEPLKLMYFSVIPRTSFFLFAGGGILPLYRVYSQSIQSSADKVLLSLIINTPMNNHHHVILLAWISLTLSRHFSLSFSTSSRSSGLHPVSSHSCCMYVWTGRPAFLWSYAGSIGVHHWWVRPCFSSSVLRVWFV